MVCVDHSDKSFKGVSLPENPESPGKCSFQMFIWITSAKAFPSWYCVEAPLAACLTSVSSCTVAVPAASVSYLSLPLGGQATFKRELSVNQVISPELSEISIIMQVEEKSGRGCPAKQGMSSKAAGLDVYHLSSPSSSQGLSCCKAARHASLQPVSVLPGT